MTSARGAALPPFPAPLLLFFLPLVAVPTFPAAPATSNAPAERPAIETTVALANPNRATVRTRIAAIASNAGLAGASGFHTLRRDPERAWRRAAMQPRRNPDGDLVFESEVEADPDGWLRVPIPLPDDPPPPGSDLSFAAAVSAPPGYRITDAFPAAAPDPGNSGTVRLQLPAPPAMLRFRVIPEDARGIGLPGLVDGAVALLLLALAGFGVRRLLRPAAAPETAESPDPPDPP